MSLGCQVDRENADIIAEFDAENKRIYNGFLAKWFGESFLKKFTKRTEEWAKELEEEGYDAHTFMTEKEFDVRAIKRYGKKAVRQILADKLMLVIQENPSVADIIRNSLLVKMPDYVKMRDVDLGRNVYKDIDKEPFQINLDRMPESTLRIALGQALNQVNQTTQKGGASASIGSRKVWFFTPKKIKRVGVAGMILEPLLSTIRDHASRISSRINYFTSNPSFIPKDEVDKDLALSLIHI